MLRQITINESFERCGKKSCKKCPHGPYYNIVLRTQKGKLNKVYIGSKLVIHFLIYDLKKEKWVDFFKSE